MTFNPRAEVAGALRAAVKAWGDDPRGGDLMHFVEDVLAPRIVQAINGAQWCSFSHGHAPDWLAALNALRGFRP